jgi:hypothetical protein
LAPLAVLQALLPLLRTSPARAKDKAERSIIVCLPAAAAYGAAPFQAADAISTAATLRAVDVLRQEVQLAAAGPQGEGMRQLRVVAVDVGAVAAMVPRPPAQPVAAAMDGWTNSEKTTYGLSFLKALEEGRRGAVARVPSPTLDFVKKVVWIVSGGKQDASSVLGLVLWNLRQWTRRHRVPIGVGGTLSFHTIALFSLTISYHSPHLRPSVEPSSLYP